jgi:hypothetical protein
MQMTLSQHRPVVNNSSATGIKLFVASESQEAWQKARDLQKQLQVSCGGKVEISASFWNFLLFKHEALRRQAVIEAGEADMIVVSRSGRDPLPAELKDWMAEWPLRRQMGTAALVALEDPAEGGQQDKVGIVHMRTVAEQCGLDFFCNRGLDEAPAEETEPLEPMPPRFVSAIPAELAGLSMPPSYREWGINE